MSRNTSGFTIIELLVVILIIGILSVIFFESFTLGLRRAELNEAASQIASDFKKARSISQKQSIDIKVSWPGSNFTTYTITQGTTVSRYNVPNGVTVSCSSDCGSNSFTYNAPYGELEGITSGPIFTLSSPSTSLNNPATEVRIVGVTGKVITGKHGL